MEDGEIVEVIVKYEHATYTVTGEQARNWKHCLPELGVWGKDVKKVIEENRRLSNDNR